MPKNREVKDVLKILRGRVCPNSHTFFQAVEEVLTSVSEVYQGNEDYKKMNILERIVTPNKIIRFKVEWMDDSGQVHVNIGFRVQFNNALGTYKGGLRFHPTVDLGVLKFLAFEQVFKNALTGLNIGGAKGGSDFDPKGKSDNEIMRFCQAFIFELYDHIGARFDVPAGDIGVGGRELAYMYAMYKKLAKTNEGALSGKPLEFGGSLMRTEATGFGLIYFTEELLKSKDLSLENKICSVSGSGNVAIYAIQKLYDMGAIPVTCSDSSGSIYDAQGIDLEILKEIKLNDRASLKEYANKIPNSKYVPASDYKENQHFVWSIPVFAAFPCATQNELTMEDAQNLIDNECRIVSEGANMPSIPQAIGLLLKNKVFFAPAKAANAGGVAISQVEMSQNASLDYKTFDEVDKKLQQIMSKIFRDIDAENEKYSLDDNYVDAANILGFKRVANAMILGGV